MTLKLAALAIAVCCFPFATEAGGYEENSDNIQPDLIKSVSRPDAHAPITVMGDHRHHAGETMISVRRMHMRMSGNKIGTNEVPDSRVLATPNGNGGIFSTLRAVPRSMSMDMTMLGLMYAPNDAVTLAAMANFVDKKMTTTSYSPQGVSLGNFTTRSEGLGDTSLTALIALPDVAGGQLHAGFGIGLPTGSIKETALIKTPMNMSIQARLPYGMQLGSGTYDAKPSLTFVKYSGDLSYGAQLGAIIRLNDNSQGYHLGHVQRMDVWGARRLNASWSVATHLNMTSTQNISGSDALIDKPIQAAQTTFYGGERATFGLGVNWIGQHGLLRGHRLAAEISGPIYEDLNGPQMYQEWALTLGYQNSF
jgi:hypothetical protein